MPGLSPLKNVKPGQHWIDKTMHPARLVVTAVNTVSDDWRDHSILLSTPDKSSHIRKGVFDFFEDCMPVPELCYTFRNLPCQVDGMRLNWCVIGGFETGGGVLEWCYTEEDAQTIMSRMELDPRSYALEVGEWDSDEEEGNG